MARRGGGPGSFNLGWGGDGGFNAGGKGLLGALALAAFGLMLWAAGTGAIAFAGFIIFLLGIIGAGIIVYGMFGGRGGA